MADNSNDTVVSGDHSPVHRSQLPRIIGWSVSAIVIFWLLIALLTPSVRGSRESARRNDCLSHLQDIAIAIQKYTDHYGHLPPAYTVDANGNRLHSWRTLILPYMEQWPLYLKIDFTKPWDDPANAEAWEQPMPVYVCASVPYGVEEFTPTTYLAVVGPDCAFSGSVPRKLSEVTDSTGTTMIVIDAPHDRAVHWMSPHDISDEEVLAFGPKSQFSHNGVFAAAFLDGHAMPIPQDIDRETLHGILTIAGGEEVRDELD